MLKVQLFDNSIVKNLNDDDFLVGTMNGICLRAPDNTIVLFYDNNAESKRLTKIFSEAAKATVVGPLMAGCYLPLCPKLSKSMNELQSDSNSPLAEFAIKGLPTILVYRERWPVAFYNGDRDVKNLVNYRNFLANNPTYREPNSSHSGDDELKSIKKSSDFRSDETESVATGDFEDGDNQGDGDQEEEQQEEDLAE